MILKKTIVRCLIFAFLALTGTGMLATNPRTELRRRATFNGRATAASFAAGTALWIYITYKLYRIDGEMNQVAKRLISEDGLTAARLKILKATPFPTSTEAVLPGIKRYLELQSHQAFYLRLRWLVWVTYGLGVYFGYKRFENSFEWGYMRVIPTDLVTDTEALVYAQQVTGRDAPSAKEIWDARCALALQVGESNSDDEFEFMKRERDERRAQDSGELRKVS